jgi:hypothetical protein
MKKLYLILYLICLSFSTNVHSQDGWFWLNPLPQGNWLTDVEFTSNNTVYVSGYGGTMMKSTDGGINFFLLENKESARFSWITLPDFQVQQMGFLKPPMAEIIGGIFPLLLIMFMITALSRRQYFTV